jgi:hypothetical protein
VAQKALLCRDLVQVIALLAMQLQHGPPPVQEADYGGRR